MSYVDELKKKSRLVLIKCVLFKGLLLRIVQLYVIIWSLDDAEKHVLYYKLS